MTTLTTESDDEVDIALFVSIDIEEDEGTFSLVAACNGYPDPVVISSGHEDEPTAATALEAVTEALAADGDFHPDVDSVTAEGAFRTAAAGPRVEMGTGEDPEKLKLSTGDPAEATPGGLYADANGEAFIVWMLSPAPEGAPLQAGIALVLTLADNKTQVLSGADRHTFAAGPVELVDATDGYLDLPELSAAPDAPPSGVARLFAVDDGAGKTSLRVRFNTGAVQTLVTEP